MISTFLNSPIKNEIIAGLNINLNWPFTILQPVLPQTLAAYKSFGTSNGTVWPGSNFQPPLNGNGQLGSDLDRPSNPGHTVYGHLLIVDNVIRPDGGDGGLEPLYQK